MEKKVMAKVCREVNVNDIIFDAYNYTKDHFKNDLTESYSRAKVVRPNMPDQDTVESELFLFWSSYGKDTGSWEISFQVNDKLQAVLDVDDFTVTCNLLDCVGHFHIVSWYVYRKPQG